MRVKEVKNYCKNCGYSEKLSLYDKITIIINRLLASLGVFFVIMTIILTPAGIINTFMNSYLMANNVRADDDVREIALEVTSECEGDKPFCYAREIYYNMSQLRYVPHSNYRLPIYDPVTVFKQGGDCKNLANSYVSFMNSLGFKSRADCNIKEKHCVAVVKYNEHEHYKDNGYIVVDLTIPKAVLVFDKQNIWDYNVVGHKNVRSLEWSK